MNYPASATNIVLASLRNAAERPEDQPGWRDVYLDNAIPLGMSDKSFRSCLSQLSQRGLYRVVDGYAWGSVKMESAP